VSVALDAADTALPPLLNVMGPFATPLPAVVSSVPPASVTALASVFCRSSEAPLPTVIAPAGAPAVPLFFSASVPAVTAVPPV
jgi:hypothetical protein